MDSSVLNMIASGRENESNYDAAAEIDSERSPSLTRLIFQSQELSEAESQLPPLRAPISLCAAWWAGRQYLCGCVDSRNAPKYVIASFLSSRNEPRHQRRLK